MFSRRALRVLEFDKVLEHVAGFASTDAGRDAVLALRPSGDPAAVRSRLEDVAEAGRFLDERRDWAFPRLPNPAAGLGRLAVEGAVLAPDELARLGALLAAARRVAQSFAADAPDRFPALDALRGRLVVDTKLEAAAERTVDEEGRVLDTASRELGRLRARLAGAHSRVVAHLESVLAGLSEAHRVTGASVTIREGRYVIPVRREGKRAVGGYVHDESATGATVYAEPPSAIAMMNRIRELERAEAREMQRILRDFTERCRPLVGPLVGSYDALVELDRRCALARTARRWQGSAPEVAPGPLIIRGGRHPLLAAAGADPVPFDLELVPDEHVVVVTGPNAGGKTVFLKAAGLVSALAQAGVIPPVDAGTRLPVFDAVFADVGDQQSIADSLSTFSAHLRNLKETLEHAGPRSLVLVDEPGTGTDPKEGAALARALVETLAELKCTAVVTSHMGELKRLAAPGNGVVNASLEFDGDRTTPTYRFAKGRPGRSYGLSIAQGLGLPASVLDRAQAYRERAEARLDGLLASLEEKERRASDAVAQAEREQERVEALGARLAEREAALTERTEALRLSERRATAQARAEARRLLMDARKEVEKAIGRLAARVDAGEPLAGAAREARKAVEAAAARLEETTEDKTGANAEAESNAARATRAGGRAAPSSAALPRPGARVVLAGSASHGTLVAVEGVRAVVDVSGVRLRVPLERLGAEDPSRSALPNGAGPQPNAAPRDASRPDAASASPAPSSRWTGPELDPSPEIDLRGRRPDEAEVVLLRAVDAAAAAGLGLLRVVHGKGTGALRKRVAQVFGQDPRIETFRPGAPGEGGHGVTVATVR